MQNLYKFIQPMIRISISTIIIFTIFTFSLQTHRQTNYLAGLPIFNGTFSLNQSDTQIKSIDFSKDVDCIIYGSSNGKLSIYNNTNPPTLHQVITDTSQVISQIHISSNSSDIYASSMDKNIRMYSLNNTNNLYYLRQTIQQDDQITCFDISYDGNILISGSLAGKITIYKYLEDKYSLDQQITQTTSIRTIALTSDGRYFITGSNQAKVYENNGTNYILLKEFNYSSTYINSVDITDHYIATGAQDGKLRIHTYQQTNIQIINIASPIHSLAISNDSQIIVVGCQDGRLYIYSKDADEFRDHQIIRINNKSVVSVAISEQLDYIGAGSEGGVNIHFECDIYYCDECLWKHMCDKCHDSFTMSENNLCLCYNGFTVSDVSGLCVSCVPRSCQRCDLDDKCALCNEGTVRDILTKNCVEKFYIVIFIVELSLVALVVIVIIGLSIRKKILLKNGEEPLETTLSQASKFN